STGGPGHRSTPSVEGAGADVPGRGGVPAAALADRSLTAYTRRGKGPRSRGRERTTDVGARPARTAWRARRRPAGGRWALAASSKEAFFDERTLARACPAAHGIGLAAGGGRAAPLGVCGGLPNRPAANTGRPAREGGPGRLLDLHLHQLAAPASLPPRLGGQVLRPRAGGDRRAHA